ncbi:hypothetical protein Deia_00295 [Candidatus Deianiraea vastatrix]|uniref:Uncharacterized protein n=1 Tax=Candidatus Deianiraea vastatrix TaxID=2163644 RepID=A0A5B8XCQ9_9RICK|nr:hypothetical protein Deia_00295 [Candidatus Deianiraea vastatrix]
MSKIKQNSNLAEKSLKENFWHQNLKIILATSFAFIVLLYFILQKDTENIKWIVSLIMSFFAGKKFK